MSDPENEKRVPMLSRGKVLKYILAAIAILALGPLSFMATDFAIKRWIGGTNWQYAKWGMSPDQLREASKGAASSITGKARYSAKGDNSLLEASYQSGPYDFIATFMFDPRSRLSAVELQLTDVAKCKELSFSLSSRYGEGTKPKHLNMTMWSDEAHGNAVTYFDEIIACRVLYSPVDQLGISSNPSEPGGL